MLALHFWSWNASVEMTTIAASVVLVNTQPLIVAALSAVWLSEAPTRQQWAGHRRRDAGRLDRRRCRTCSQTGALSLGGRAALGDLLALAGAITAAGYYAIGRRLRATLDLWAYVALVYGTCLLVLLAIAVDPGRSPRDHFPRASMESSRCWRSARCCSATPG